MPQKAKTFDEVKAILDKISFLDRKFLLMEKGDGFLLQVTYYEDDVVTGEKNVLQKARKWYVSSFSTTTEIVRTAYKAIETSMMHVVDEHFLYKGKRIHNPHFDVEALVELADHPEDRRLD